MYHIDRKTRDTITAALIQHGATLQPILRTASTTNPTPQAIATALEYLNICAALTELKHGVPRSYYALPMADAIHAQAAQKAKA